MPSNKHVSVLQKEAIDGLNLKIDSKVIDMTLGRGGDSSKILEIIKEGHLYACDYDQDALDYSSSILSKIGNNYSLYHSPYSKMIDLLKEEGVNKVDAILLDIGVSSPQFDNPERGFSYRFDGKLDMRMDLSSSFTAYDIVNTYSEKELRDLIFKYGEDRSAPLIAKAIVKRREEKPIETTLDLVDVIKSALPSFILNKKGHPAKQTFQALRYEVNGEIKELEIGLKKGIEFLSSKGRLAIITFNSLEDRIAKNIFKEYTQKEEVNKFLPVDNSLKPIEYRLITRKPIEPSSKELEDNPRSHSAKLRIIERI